MLDHVLFFHDSDKLSGLHACANSHGLRYRLVLRGLALDLLALETAAFHDMT